MRADRHPGESVPAAIGHLDGVEALRAIAVTWVVLFHYLVVREAARIDDGWNAWIAASPTLNAIVRNGYLGVDLFFLVTGFLLVQPWIRAAATGAPRPSTADFYRRRVRRIVPAYYVQLVLLFAVFVPLVHGMSFVRANPGFIAGNAVAHATFLHYTTPLTSASLNVNGALWTLALEAQFYLLLPLLAPLFVRRPWICGLAMVALAAIWRALAASGLDALVAWEMAIGARWQVPEAAIRHLLATQLPGYAAHFALGMGLGVAWFRHRDRAVGRVEATAWLLALGAALGVLDWAYARGGGAYVGVWGSWLATLACLGIAFATLLRASPFVRAVLLRAPVLAVGRMSYSIYLYHLPLLYLALRFRLFEGSPWALPAYLALTLVAAWISYRLVERPFLRRGRL